MAKRSPRAVRHVAWGFSFVFIMLSSINISVLFLVRRQFTTHMLTCQLERLKLFCYTSANVAPSTAATLKEGGEIMEIIILLGVAVVGGTIGTVLGGLILDYIRAKRQ